MTSKHNDETMMIDAKEEEELKVHNNASFPDAAGGCNPSNGQLEQFFHHLRNTLPVKERIERLRDCQRQIENALNEVLTLDDDADNRGDRQDFVDDHQISEDHQIIASDKLVQEPPPNDDKSDNSSSDNSVDLEQSSSINGPVSASAITSQPHQCPHCDKSYILRSNLVGHLLKHTGQRPFLCLECGKFFRLINCRLFDHLLKHIGRRAFQCTMCNGDDGHHQQFIQNGAFKEHLRTCHNIVEQQQLEQCPFEDCTFEAATRWHIGRHVRRQHLELIGTLVSMVQQER